MAGPPRPGIPAARHSGRPSSRRRTLKPVPAQLSHGLEGEDAIGTPGNRPRSRSSGRARTVQFLRRDVHRTGDVAQREFIFRSQSSSGTSPGFLRCINSVRDTGCMSTRAKTAAHNAIDHAEIAGGQFLHGLDEGQHAFALQGVEHEFAGL